MRVAVIIFLILIACNEPTSQHEKTGHDNQPKPDKLHTIMEETQEKMERYNYTNDPDIDFAALMYIHHAFAVDMAEREIELGKDNSLVSLAKNIIVDQRKEMAQFDSYIHSATENDKSEEFAKETKVLMKHTHSVEHANSIDTLFVKLMIPHHQGAVDMSKLYLKYAKDNRLKQTAQSIISSQEKEIAFFNSWLGNNKDF